MSLLSIICSLFAFLVSFQEDLSFSGIVTTYNGRPIVDATVVLHHEDGEHIRAAGTDEMGAFEFSGLSEGRYIFRVAKDGYDVHSETIQIGEGGNLQGQRFSLLDNHQRLADLVSARDRANFEIAGAELRNGKADRALNIYTSFLRRYPYLVKTHYNVGLCYIEKADDARGTKQRTEFYEFERLARRHFLVALERYPDFSGARKAMADSYIRTQMMSEAAGEYEILLKQLPDDPSLWYTFGELSSYLKQLDAAENAFRKVLEIDPSFVDAHAKIGAIRMILGDLDGAISSYEKFLLLAPDSNMAEITQELLEQCRQQLEERKDSQQKEQNPP